MVGIFGNNNGTRTITLVNISSDLLASAMNAKIAEGQVSKFTAPRQSTGSAFGPDVIAPWDRSPASLTLPDGLGEQLARSPLFSRNDPDVLTSGGNDTSENLFRLWKGLKKMQELANFALNDSRSERLMPQLDAQFSRYQSEVKDFLSDNTFDGVNMLHGPLSTKVETDARIPRSRSVYEGRLQFSTTEDVVPGLDSQTKFDINIVKNDNTSVDIAIDLADMGATEKTVANIVSHVNEKLEAAEVTTRFRTNRDDDGRVGLKIERSILETVSLSPVDSDPAIYVSGTSGNDEFAKASLRKFTDIDTVPTQDFDVKQEARDGVSEAFASARGPNGEVYTLGTTTGDIGGQVVGGEQDVFLTRHDAAGNEVWRRLVGASGSAEGLGLAVAADGSIAISGKTDAPLTESSPDNGINSFVTLYDADGEAVWTRNTGPAAADSAFSVAFDDVSGDVIVVGATSGALSGQSHSGGQDAYVSRLSASSGSLLDQIQFGDAGNEIATAVTVKDGVVYVAGQDDSQGFLKTFDIDDLTSGPVLDTAIGGAGETTRAAAIEVDDTGRIFIAGTTTDATFTGAGVDGRLTHSGSNDAFVARFDGGTGAMDFGAYIGSAGSDQANGLALSNGEIFVVGETRGDLQGNSLFGSQDGFLARLDANGAPQSVTTMSGINGHAALNGIVVDDSGDSVLTKLGLGHGDIGDLGSLTVTSNSAVRPGMSFSLAVGDGPTRQIEIEADDSIRWVAFQMNRVLGQDGVAEVKKDGDFEYLRITARGDNEIKVGGGPDGFDALPGLGLREGSVFGKDVKEDKSFFALGFGFIDFSNREKIEEARDHMGFTMQQVEKAFDFLRAEEKDPLAKRRQEAALAQPSAYLQRQIASYQEALFRLTGQQ
ncbi:MAG: hypothetical protein P1U65_00205 [Minwuia sp.]|nr:hypothetical protein [Minwuia sp.]